MFKLESLVTLAVLGAVLYAVYELSQIFNSDSGGAEGYCGQNPDSVFCSLFGGGAGTGSGSTPSAPTACIGLGCTSNLAESYWCEWFPSECGSGSAATATASLGTGGGGGF